MGTSKPPADRTSGPPDALPPHAAAEPTSAPISTPSRRWIVVLLAGVALAATAAVIYPAWNMRSAQHEQQVAEQLKERGVVVMLDLDKRVDQVTLAGKPAEDEIMALVGQLHSLKRLNLWQSGCTDEDIAQLRNLTSLVNLLLAEADITSKACETIGRMTRLQALHLGQTGVGDEGLAHLAGLSALSNLTLSDTQITDAGLAHLKRLKNLERLELDGTAVTDAGIKHLAEMKELSVVNLRGTQVTAAGVASLREALPNAEVQY